MAENINTAITVEAWAEITIKEWIKKIKALGIGDSKTSTGKLVASFYHHVITSANGIPEYINFIFAYYGRMVDWGVGRGVTIENRDKLANIGATKREQKPWFSPVFKFHVKRLEEIMAEKYAQQAAIVVINNLESGEKSKRSSSSRKSSSKSTIDTITGRKKITIKEFEKMRKEQGW